MGEAKELQVNFEGDLEPPEYTSQFKEVTMKDLNFDKDDEGDFGATIWDTKLEASREVLKMMSRGKYYLAQFAKHNTTTGKKETWWETLENHPMLEAESLADDLYADGFKGWLVVADFKEITKEEFEFSIQAGIYACGV